MTEPKSPLARSWIEIGQLADLTDGAGREFIHYGQSIALFRLSDRVIALGGLCPHQGSHLANGLVDLEMGTITCSRKGCLRWRFDLATGTHTAGLPVTCSVFPVAIRSGVSPYPCRKPRTSRSRLDPAG